MQKSRNNWRLYLKEKLYNIINLLNELLKGNYNAAESNNIDTYALYQSLLNHRLNILLYPVIRCYYKEDDSKRDQLFKEWTSIVQKNTFLNLIYVQQISVIYSLLISNGLTPLIIKGLAVSRYYKYPQYRSIGDLDILVGDSEWNRAIEVLIQHGYQQINDDSNPLHIEFIKKNSIMIELHKQLIHTGYLGERNTTKWYKFIWEHKQQLIVDGIKFYALSNEDELINQVTHFASHFIYHGTRLQHIFEISLIININSKLNWEYITETLNLIEFIPFAKLLFSICKTYFNSAIPENLCNTEYIIQKDFIENLFEYFSIEKNKGDFRGWINILSNYRFIFKHRLLQPMAFFIELKSQIKIHGFILPFIIKNTFRNMKMINKKLHIIRNYGFMI